MNRIYIVLFVAIASILVACSGKPKTARVTPSEQLTGHSSLRIVSTSYTNDTTLGVVFSFIDSARYQGIIVEKLTPDSLGFELIIIEDTCAKVISGWAINSYRW